MASARRASSPPKPRSAMPSERHRLFRLRYSAGRRLLRLFRMHGAGRYPLLGEAVHGLHPDDPRVERYLNDFLIAAIVGNSTPGQLQV